jgi:hypothetical protein
MFAAVKFILVIAYVTSGTQKEMRGATIMEYPTHALCESARQEHGDRLMASGQFRIVTSVCKVAS